MTVFSACVYIYKNNYKLRVAMQKPKGTCHYAWFGSCTEKVISLIIRQIKSNNPLFIFYFILTGPGSISHVKLYICCCHLSPPTWIILTLLSYHNESPIIKRMYSTLFRLPRHWKKKDFGFTFYLLFI